MFVLKLRVVLAVCVWTGTMSVASTRSSTGLHHFYWNSSNPLFDAVSNSVSDDRPANSYKMLNVRLLDTLIIHCPKHSIRSGKRFDEHSLLFLVSRSSYKTCSLDGTGRSIGYCEGSTAFGHRIHVTFRRQNAQFGKFMPGRNYYIISTSSGRPDGLYNRDGGLCSAKNMRLKIHLIKEPYKTMAPITAFDLAHDHSRNENGEKRLDYNKIFMAEEFNELTWKKTISDAHKYGSDELLLRASSIEPSNNGIQSMKKVAKFPLIKQLKHPIPLVASHRRRHHAMIATLRQQPELANRSLSRALESINANWIDENPANTNESVGASANPIDEKRTRLLPNANDERMSNLKLTSISAQLTQMNDDDNDVQHHPDDMMDQVGEIEDQNQRIATLSHTGNGRDYAVRSGISSNLPNCCSRIFVLLFIWTFCANYCLLPK